MDQVRKTVFALNSLELSELLLSHGLPKSLCETFLKFELDGNLFKSWSVLSEEELKRRIKEELKTSELKDNEFRHFSAILQKYRFNPYDQKHKVIADNVHGQMSVHPLLMKIIDTPQFQRLRFIKQLGTTSHVYPTGNHTRFEHSIGTSHIAGILMEHLKSQKSLKITNADVLCVQIAGLCHDLGHGPFSHTFEEVIDRLCPENKWKHEMATIQMFDKILSVILSVKVLTVSEPETSKKHQLKEEFEAYGLFENELQLIKDMIYQPELKSSTYADYSQKLQEVESLKKRGLDKSFLFEIVSNNLNGIDVDKFDYFERDSKQLGFTTNFNFKRYIMGTRVIKENEKELNQICCRHKDYQDLYEMFHVRELLTRRAYKHHTGSSINFMYIDALVKADKYFNFSAMIKEKNIDAFEELTDSVEETIIHSTDERLKESKEILGRVCRRELYKLAGSVVLPPDKADIIKSLKDSLIKALEIKDVNDNDSDVVVDCNVNDGNVVIDLVRFNYGSKDKNPIENARFYNKHKLDISFKIKKEESAGMLLKQFEDMEIRIYSKQKEDYIFLAKVTKLFVKWCKDEKLPSH